MKKGLGVSNLRQKIVSSNIANLQTPDYKVNRVKFEETLSKAIKQIPMSITNNMHLGRVNEIEPIVVKRDTTYLNDNGNNVDVDVEMAELAVNELYYGTLVRQVNAKLAGYNYVINRT